MKKLENNPLLYGIVNCLRNAGYTVEQVRYGE